MKPLICLFFLILVSHGSSLFAQSPRALDIDAPKPPLLATVRSNTQWTVTCVPKKPEAEPTTPDEIRNRKLRQRYSPRELSKHVMKSSDKLHILRKFEGGLTSESWSIAGMIHTLPMREGEPIESRLKDPNDFPELSWVNADNYRGAVSLRGREYYTYSASESAPEASQNVPTGIDPANAPASSEQKTKMAYISVETRLPAMVDDGVNICRYEFQSGGSVNIPPLAPQILAIIKKTQ